MEWLILGYLVVIGTGMIKKYQGLSTPPVVLVRRTANILL